MNRDVYEDSIILIVPSGAGKSIVGEELANCLNGEMTRVIKMHYELSIE